MAPGCRVIITVPGGPMTLFDKHIGHRKHYSSQELRLLLRAAVLKLRKLEDSDSPSITFTVLHSYRAARDWSNGFGTSLPADPDWLLYFQYPVQAKPGSVGLANGGHRTVARTIRSESFAPGSAADIPTYLQGSLTARCQLVSRTQRRKHYAG